MRFNFVDRVQELQPGRSIRAIKSLSLTEDYLLDHFPGFPVMPGALLLETMTQAGAWLVRASEDFEHSMVILKEARGVNCRELVGAGCTLTILAEVLGQDARETQLQARIAVEGHAVITAQLVLERFNLSELGRPSAADERIRRDARELFRVLGGPASIVTATAPALVLPELISAQQVTVLSGAEALEDLAGVLGGMSTVAN